MKKMLIGILLACFLIGCNSPPKFKYDSNSKMLVNEEGESYFLEEFEYDGCTYLAITEQIGSPRIAITHKGNCPNCSK